MSVSEVNFTFDGLHCYRDFGCIWIENPGRTVAPKMNLNTYNIAGVSGTVLLGDKATYDPYTVSGALVPMRTPKTIQAAQELARQVSAWLKRGRKALCWDYEPNLVRYAEVLQATTWDAKAWMDGGVNVTFQVQPFAYDLLPTQKNVQKSAGTDLIELPVVTDLPCPVSVIVYNPDSQAMTRVVVSTPSGQTVDMSNNFSLQTGQRLRLDMEPPIGAVIVSGDTETNALQYAAQFDQLTVASRETITVTTDTGATVTVSARGCYL